NLGSKIHVDFEQYRFLSQGARRMRKTLALIFCFCTVVVLAQSTTPQNAFTPDQVKWGPAPPIVEPGAQLAVLEGDPMGSSGDYTVRLKMPAGYKIAPHWHPTRETATVISGNF